MARRSGFVVAATVCAMVALVCIFVMVAVVGPAQKRQQAPPAPTPPPYMPMVSPNYVLPAVDLSPPPSSAAPDAAGSSLLVALPPFDFQFPQNTTLLLVEVGTNVNPDFAKVVLPQPQWFFLMVEPVTVLEAMRWCNNKAMQSRCALAASAAAHYDGWGYISMSPHSTCGSMMRGGLANSCAEDSQPKMGVQSYRLDTLLARVPRQLPIFVSIDAQGMDFFSASGLAGIKDQVVGIIVECQDLPKNIPRHWLYENPHKKNCGEIIDCILTQWGGGWRLRHQGADGVRRCQMNAGWPFEYNCVFVNDGYVGPTELHTQEARKLAARYEHPLNQNDLRNITHHTKCPVNEWKLRKNFE